MENIRSFGRWEHTDCDECGCEFQVTRTEPKEFSGKIVCNDCEMYERGYKDALHVAPEGYALVPIDLIRNVCGRLQVYGDEEMGRRVVDADAEALKGRIAAAQESEE